MPDGVERARDGVTSGVVSLVSAITAPLIFASFVGVAARAFADDGWLRSIFLLLAPAGAVVAIVAGVLSRRSTRRPLSGAIGLVAGIVEVVLMAPMVFLPLFLWDEINDTL